MSIANELITRGWAQHALEDEDGAVCLLGALRAARGYAPDDLSNPHGRDYGVVARLLGCDVAMWNNAPERTFDDVLRVAKEADEILDGRS